MKNQAPTNELQMSLLNMRQLYESAVQEKMMLAQENSMLKATVVALIYPDESAFLQKSNLDAIEQGSVSNFEYFQEQDGVRIELTIEEPDYGSETG